MKKSSFFSRQYLRIISLLILLSFLGAAFQNCSPTQFGEIVNPSVVIKGNGNLSQSFQAKTQDIINKADVLFILDDSCSLAAITAAVRDGFLSVAANAYPADTLMAVTNMAPAYYTDAGNGVFDLTKPFINSNKILESPGFIKLVNKNSIDSYKNIYSEDAARFNMEGCANSWFQPNEKNSSGTNCLSAHTQTALICTGVETGVVTLSQLVKNNFNLAQRTFREGSLVNIIFVSDTHDPGASYYGRPGAPAKIFDYAEIVSDIKLANPNIAGIKFHGIAPLPPVGDARLEGLQTVGRVPATIQESNVSGELLYDFSYLPFVASSGGIAMHPVGNSWSEALSSMVKEVGVRRTPSVKLAYPAEKIVRVKVDEQLLDSNSYRLEADQQTIELTAQTNWPLNINIQVEYVRNP